MLLLLALLSFQLDSAFSLCPLALWPFGPLALWPLWPFGPLALWPFGALALWPFGPLALWPFGPLALWPCGPVALLAFLALWPWGLLALWAFTLPFGPLPSWPFGLALWLSALQFALDGFELGFGHWPLVFAFGLLLCLFVDTSAAFHFGF